MPRKYAGVMSLLGMSLVLIRAMKSGQGFEATIVTAMAWMAALGVVGWVVGAIAQATVDESVRTVMEQQLTTGLPELTAPGKSAG